MTAHAELEVTSHLRELPIIRAFVGEFCQNIQLFEVDEESLMWLQLAVTEAASNIIKHAYHGRDDQPILVEADVSEDQVTIQLQHFGDAFDPQTVAPPVFDGSREGGFGVYIIAHAVDEVHYSCDAQGKNCVTLVKRLKGAKRNGHDH